MVVDANKYIVKEMLIKKTIKTINYKKAIYGMKYLNCDLILKKKEVINYKNLPQCYV